MLKKIKEKLDLLIDANQGTIDEKDFAYIKAYIDVLYAFAKGKYIEEE